MIYLDNAATTKIKNECLEDIVKYNKELYFNPSSSYHLGIEVNKKIESVKKHICDSLNIDFKQNVIFTGSATEANNIAILGSFNKRFKQLVFSEGEHPAVYNVAKNLKDQGFDVVFIPLQSNGEINYKILEEKLKTETSFISIMAVSNETGAINDLDLISNLKTKYCPDAIFHCDCVQAYGKIDLDFDNLAIDLASISAHKLYGPKGVGALVNVSNLNIKPIHFGGGQEYGIRSGTENVPNIIAFDNCILDAKEIKKNYEFCSNLKKAFIEELKNTDFEINGNGSPYILSLSLSGVRGETIQHMLENEGVIISTGSACSSKKIGNRILNSLGQKNIIGSVRVSFSVNNTMEEVKIAGQKFDEVYVKLVKKLKG